MMDSKEINLQTWSHQYENTPNNSMTKSQTKFYTELLYSPNGNLHVPPPKAEVLPNITKGSLCRNTASSQVTHTYNIVDDLVQSLSTMLMLEVLHLFPSH